MALTQISTAGVKDDAVTAGKIPADAVGSSEIAANAVGSSELADNAVDTAAIADDAVTGAKIADDAINSEHYTDGSIDTAHIADSQVTTAKVADDAVTAAKLASNAVVNASVDASAAIAGSKIAPDFGSQDITTTGDLGIGTSSPDRTIHCHNSSNTTNVRAKFSNGTTGEGASDGFEIGINGSDPAQAVLVNYEASPIAFFTGGAERIRVDESGHLRFSGTTEEIKLNTSDGSDNGFLNLAGGGECSQLRGSQIVMYGNEYSGQEGQLLLMAGNSSNTNGVVRFYTGGSERARIQSGGGISFNGDTAAANALDDYEEGGWTPSVVNGGSSIGNDSNNNRYVKVGSMVFVTFELYSLGSPNGSTLEIGNLPYSVATHREGTGSCMSNNVDYSSGRTMISVYAYSGSAKMRFYASGSDTNWRAIEGNDFGSGSIIGSIAYHTV